MKRLMSFKLIVFCLFFLLAGAIFIAPAQAQSPKLPTGNLPTDPHGYQITTDEMQAYYNAISDCSTPSLECLVRNVSRFTAIEWVQDINGPKGDCVSNSGGCKETSDVGGKNIASGALGGLASLMGGMYARPPASAGTYIADVLNSAHVVTPAYAQGLGFASLDPVLNLWKTFRNIAYMFFVVIFVITGFLIMFRQKVGQAAITAQQAIPNIIISLLMVTFSYAIGGFLIDLMYLSMVLIIGIFQQNLVDSRDYLSMDIFSLGDALWKALPKVSELGDTISTFMENLGNTSNVASTVGKVFGGLTLSIILTIAMLIGVVKLFFELLRAYATIVVSIVTAPLTLMMNAMPGSNAFMTWIKTLVGHLLPFPTVLVVVAMFDVFVNESWGGGGFMPPFLLGGGQLNIIPSVLGLAILLALPEIVKHIREAIAPKNGFAEMILGAASKNFKAGWTGEGLKGIGAKRIMGAAGKAPLALAGGTIGYMAGNRYADSAGLTGRERLGARLVGAGVGAGVGTNAVKIGKNVGRGIFGQVRDTAIKMKTDEFTTKLVGAMDQQHVGGETSIAQRTKDAQVNPNPTDVGTAPSDSRLDGLR